MSTTDDPAPSTRELERLWQWGLHQDDVVVNRMSVFSLAQYLLLFAAVALLPAVRHGAIPETVLLLVLDVSGIAFTFTLWYVVRLSVEKVELLGQEMQRLDPDLYGRLRGAIYAQRPGRSLLSRTLSRFFPRRDTLYVFANGTSAIMAAVWLVTTAVSVALVVVTR